jgi:hypothetical protein
MRPRAFAAARCGAGPMRCQRSPCLADRAVGHHRAQDGIRQSPGLPPSRAQLPTSASISTKQATACQSRLRQGSVSLEILPMSSTYRYAWRPSQRIVNSKSAWRPLRRSSTKLAGWGSSELQSRRAESAPGSTARSSEAACSGWEKTYLNSAS